MNSSETESFAQSLLAAVRIKQTTVGLADAWLDFIL